MRNSWPAVHTVTQEQSGLRGSCVCGPGEDEAVGFLPWAVRAPELFLLLPGTPLLGGKEVLPDVCPRHGCVAVGKP